MSKHPTKPLFDPWSEEFADIDIDLVPLIRAIWRYGIPTVTCCQGVPLRTSHGGGRSGPEHWVLLELSTGAQLEEFLTIAATGDDDIEDVESIRNRIWSADEPDDWATFRERRCWQYGVGVLDHGVKAFDDDGNETDGFYGFYGTDGPDMGLSARGNSPRPARRGGSSVRPPRPPATVVNRKVSTTAAGYGWQHQKLRAQWKREVDAGRVRCARCRKWLAPGSAFDLGHVDGSNKRRYAGPECVSCNRATSTHRKQRDGRPRRVSREPRVADDDGPAARVVDLGRVVQWGTE